jgi:hypothetical protein
LEVTDYYKNCFFYVAIGGLTIEVKGVGRTQLHDDLRNRKRYWELKEEAEEWQFIS